VVVDDLSLAGDFIPGAEGRVRMSNLARYEAPVGKYRQCATC
jgi:hypothetical protein